MSMDMFLSALLLLSWLILTTASVFHILLNKRDPRGAALWLVLSGLVPFLGPFLYWVLGINRISRSGVVRARRRSRPGWEHWHPGSDEVASEGSYPDLYPLMEISRQITGRPLLSGNTVDPLHDGNQTFPAMLAAIGAAERFVNLSTYILDRDAVGSRIINALCTAASRGVEVRVLVDGLGTSRSAIAMARRLLKAGARLSIFHPLFGIWVRRPGINMRNHRKLLIIDGSVGFTGGINISSRHFFTLWKKVEPVRDVHFRITGPVIEHMQMVFAEDWYSSTGELLVYSRFPGEGRSGGDAHARAVSSGPDEDLERIYHLILGALRSAKTHVLIMTPYFIPDRGMIHALGSAVFAGVKVEILLPEKSDHPLVQNASMAFVPEIMESGVKVVLVPPPFVHSKLMIVDGVWSLIGSANIDPRSFRLNFEFDLEVYSKELAASLLRYTEKISSGGTVLALEDLKARPLRKRLLEGASKVLSPYL